MQILFPVQLLYDFIICSHIVTIYCNVWRKIKYLLRSVQLKNIYRMINSIFILISCWISVTRIGFWPVERRVRRRTVEVLINTSICQWFYKILQWIKMPLKTWMKIKGTHDVWIHKNHTSLSLQPPFVFLCVDRRNHFYMILNV